MLFEKIESAGLAQYSYIIGDEQEAVVIDPRRDCAVYLERTCRQGYRLAHVIETHCNEDYVIGSREIEALTGAAVWHADAQWEYGYGQGVRDGQVWKIGRLTLSAILSPGHTPGSMCYLLRDAGGVPWMLFTGDVLFAGEVGRVDLAGAERMQAMAGMLYDTLFNKLLPLGDGIIVCPAHGTGSVCGSAIAERCWTTIGLERKCNPRLQHQTKSAFIAAVARVLERPPYFDQMEKLNRQGPPVLKALPVPTPLSPAAFALAAETAIVVDTRKELGFNTAHVPGSLSLWLDGLPSFAGWFLPYDRPLLLVNEGEDPLLPLRYLIRLGYDKVEGCLAGSMLSWHEAGGDSIGIRTITVHSLCRMINEGQQPWILDVRSDDEWEGSGYIAGAHHLHITQLPLHLDEIPDDLPVYVLCGSGLRSTIAASILQREGWKEIVVILGGMSGWNSIKCPKEKSKY